MMALFSSGTFRRIKTVMQLVSASTLILLDYQTSEEPARHTILSLFLHDGKVQAQVNDSTLCTTLTDVSETIVCDDGRQRTYLRPSAVAHAAANEYREPNRDIATVS